MKHHALALLDTYKVRWSRETVARDVVQNFFDEVADFDAVTIDIDDRGKTVRIAGPSTFDVAYLRFLGATTKRAPERRSAGGFGEGFKIAALVLLRDFGCEVRAGAGTWELTASLRPMKLGRELCYEVTEVPAHAGSWVAIAGADKGLRDAFRGARDWFCHPKNPRLGKPLFVDEALGIGVYHALDNTRGDLFYRRQQRGVLRYGRGAALTFRLDDRLDVVDADRDRRDIRAVRPVIVEIARRLPDAEVEKVIRHLRMYWQGGGGVLSAVLAGVKGRGLTMAFPRRWVAKVPHSYRLERHAEKSGFHLGVRALATVGMPTVVARFGDGAEPRAPTPLEAARLAIAREAYHLFADAAPMFRHVRVVDIADAEEWTWRTSDVGVVPADALAAPFAEGLSRCLGVMAHSRARAATNADRLTVLLEGAIGKLDRLDDLAARWADPSLSPVYGALDEDEEIAIQAALVQGDEPGVVHCEVIAPAGFPPAAAIEHALRRVALRAGIKVDVRHARAECERKAARMGARGLPTVWVGGRALDPPRGASPYVLRTFAAPDGGRRLVPDDVAIRAALEAARHGRRGSSSALDAAQQAVWRRWARRLYPDEEAKSRRARVLERAMKAQGLEYTPHAIGDLPWTLGTALRSHVCEALAARAVPAERELAEAEALLAEGRVAMRALLERITAAHPELARRAEDRTFEAVWTRLLNEAVAYVDVGAEPDQAVALAGRCVEPLTELARTAAEAPLDGDCAQACASVAMAAWWEAGGPSEAATAAARALLDQAVAVAVARHDERDADGEPPRCYTLPTVLNERLGRARPVGRDTIVEAVKRTWDEELAAGADEIAAAERCLAVAADLDARAQARAAEDAAAQEAAAHAARRAALETLAQSKR